MIESNYTPREDDELPDTIETEGDNSATQIGTTTQE